MQWTALGFLNVEEAHYPHPLPFVAVLVDCACDELGLRWLGAETACRRSSLLTAGHELS